MLWFVVKTPTVSVQYWKILSYSYHTLDLKNTPQHIFCNLTWKLCVFVFLFFQFNSNKRFIKKNRNIAKEDLIFLRFNFLQQNSLPSFIWFVWPIALNFVHRLPPAFSWHLSKSPKFFQMLRFAKLYFRCKKKIYLENIKTHKSSASAAGRGQIR